MKYLKSQFKTEYYKLWQLGLLLPVPVSASTFSVKYRKNNLDQYSRVTLKATGVSDALERACFAITYSSPWRPEDIDLHAVYDADENLLWVDEPFYNLIQKKNEFRGMERRDFLIRFGATSAAILFGLRPMQASAGTTSVALSGSATGFNIIGEQLYTTAGSYSWTVPAGVTSVCVVCVGGGATGNWNYAGSGGGLVYKNSLGTTPAASMAVVVGTANQDSSFNTSIIATCGTTSAVGSNSGGDGGGNGGFGGATGNIYGGDGGGGGGGAGGYTGNGGSLSRVSWQTTGVAGAGGGGGSGASGGGGYLGPGGGGVGIFGAGANGTAAGSTNGAGGGGSGGTAGGNSNNSTHIGTGGAYGGGGGSGTSVGGAGAVRILWGAGRSFPNSAT